METFPYQTDSHPDTMTILLLTPRLIFPSWWRLLLRYGDFIRLGDDFFLVVRRIIFRTRPFLSRLRAVATFCRAIDFACVLMGYFHQVAVMRYTYCRPGDEISRQKIAAFANPTAPFPDTMTAFTYSTATIFPTWRRLIQTYSGLLLSRLRAFTISSEPLTLHML